MMENSAEQREQRLNWLAAMYVEINATYWSGSLPTEVQFRSEFRRDFWARTSYGPERITFASSILDNFPNDLLLLILHHEAIHLRLWDNPPLRRNEDHGKAFLAEIARLRSLSVGLDPDGSFAPPAWYVEPPPRVKY